MTNNISETEELIREQEVIERAGRLHWVHWAVVAGSLVLTLGAWYFTKSQIEEKIALQFQRESKQTIELISERMSKYEDALRGGVAAIHSQSHGIDYEEWKRFSDALHIERTYPGINGIGVIYYVPDRKNLEEFLAREREMRPDFKIHPQHEIDEFWPITYIEPVEMNAAAVGLDMAHEQNRYQAAKKARDTGSAQITAPIFLVQDEEKTPGFLFYVPFYERGQYETAEERTEHFVGHVYAPFVMKELMAGTLEKGKRSVGIRILDKEEDVILYDEHVATEEDYDPNPLFKKKFDINFYGRTWCFDIWSAKSFRVIAHNDKPMIILAGGLFIDSMLLALFILLSRSNRRAIGFAERMTSKLKLAVEGAEAGSKAKSEFLANMSHEIRTPLNGIIGTAGLIEETKLTKQQKNYLKTIRSSSDSLLQLINDILDFSKIEAGKLEFEMLPFDFQVLMEEVRSTTGVNVDEGIDFTINWVSGTPRYVVGDPGRIRQVLYNLVGNAIKFTDQGAITLSAELASEKDGRHVFLISVQDTGIGIPEHKLEYVFDKFGQAEESTTRRFGGTGLGLAICSKLVGLMDGELFVESKEGQGSKFSFTLPLDLADEAEIQAHDTVPDINMDDLEFDKVQILLAEDNVTNMIIATEMLEQFGCHVTPAGNGLEAVERAEKQKFDLIFMDCRMPEMDGYEATIKIRENEEGNNTEVTPIVALTANAMKGDRDKCFEAGMDDYISKPVKKAQLGAALVKWVPEEKQKVA